METQIKFPKFLTTEWYKSKLVITNKDAEKIGTSLGKNHPEWDTVKNLETFAEVYLSCFTEDPAIGADCRKALGKGAPPLLKLTKTADVAELPKDTSAKKAFGNFAVCARSAAENGKDSEATEFAVLELLEFGSVASEAFELAHETQDSKSYKEFVELARSVEITGLTLALVDEGLLEAEAKGEGKAMVEHAYAIGRLVSATDRAADAEDQVKALQQVATCLAEASRNVAAHMQISASPLGADTALGTLREALAIIEEHLEGSEDEGLAIAVGEAKKLVDASKEGLIERHTMCEIRIKTVDMREKAVLASSLADEAKGVEVKNLADAKKMEKKFLEANSVAKEAIVMVIDCAKSINDQPRISANDNEAEALFKSIEESFKVAKEDASKDVKASEKAAAEAHSIATKVEVEKDVAKTPTKKVAPAIPEVKTEAPAPVAKVETPVAEAASDKPSEEGAPGTADAAKIEEARQALLESLKKFGGKRWDTNLATQTLRRLIDPRKEVIGQFWDALKNENDDIEHRAEKFIDQFKNTMDARRRLDAVVRLMGRGQGIDPRTAKWFTDSIINIAEHTKTYYELIKKD